MNAMVEFLSNPPSDHCIVPLSPIAYSATMGLAFFYEIQGPTAPWTFSSFDRTISILAAFPVFKYPFTSRSNNFL